MVRKTLSYLLATVIVLLIIQACVTYNFRTNYKMAVTLMHATSNLQTKPFLKTHLKNGDVCIYKDSWTVDTISNLVTGSGTRYNFNRKEVHKGDLSILIDSVAIFETNTKIKDPEKSRVAALSILAAVDVAVGIFCLANPKACFGSCPTFYINENDNFHYADAEGFSNAICPSMEYFDVDALNNTCPTYSEFSITMKNEALETHCVKEIKLLASPRSDGERVYHMPSNEFYLCKNIYRLTRAMGNEGDITTLLKYEDRQERFSFSDNINLSSKEEIVLEFDEVDMISNLGLILNFRQTLMTTYFIYNAIAYMGDEVGDIFARLENNKEIHGKLKEGIKKELGNIDVYMWNRRKNSWEFQNGFYETGPIAVNKQLIRLGTPTTNSRVKLKIVVNRGLWRMDYVALTNIKKKITPIEISPSSILSKGKFNNMALSQLNDPDKYLISMPGNEYKLGFTLPDKSTDYELFLYSKGYYLEWMREHWIKDKNLLKLKQMVDNPKKYLRDEASNYKQYEVIMEEEFWNSKIDTKNFSYNEN